MSLRSRMRDTITINAYSSGAVDIFGDTTETFSDGAGVEVPAYVEQMAATEHLDDRDLRITRYMVMIPPEITITAMDKVTYNETSFRVVGQPEIVSNWQGAQFIRCQIESLLG